MWGIFKKKKVKYLGRGGMIFTFEGREYTIDSEMLMGECDMVIYTDSLKSENKEQVLTALVEYLQNKEKLKIELQP